MIKNNKSKISLNLSKSMFKAVIFDMDGVLIESLSHWNRIEADLMRARGIELTAEMKKRYNGRSMVENAKWIKENYNIPETAEQLMLLRKQSTDVIYQELAPALPGAEQIIKLIKKIGIKQAIASGSSLHRINLIVDRFGWREHFDHLVSAEHVNNVGKPAPDIYLHTASLLSLDPAQCVVIEDSENGMRAAKAAGMSCVAVINDNHNEEDCSVADFIVDSLEHEDLRRYLGIQQ